MSNAPTSLLTTRSHMAAVTGSPLTDIGIAADASHLTSGGYHCGAADLAAINAVANDDYSIRQPRDRAQYNADRSTGANWASAMDYPDDWPIGGRAAWIRFNNILRAQLGAQDHMLRAIRGINYTPDGTTKRRFDCLTLHESSTTDTVTWHTHIEWWRDTINDTAARDDATTRLCQIARAAIENVSLSTIVARDAAPPPNTGVSMEIFTVTGCPANTTDAAGATLVEGGQYLVTPKGLFGLTGTEFFSQPAAIQPNRIAMTYPRAMMLCSALSEKPATAAEIAAAVAAQYPAQSITQQVILDAMGSQQGHDTFVGILDTPEGQQALAQAATTGVAADRHRDA